MREHFNRREIAALRVVYMIPGYGVKQYGQTYAMFSRLRQAGLIQNTKIYHSPHGISYKGRIEITPKGERFLRLFGLHEFGHENESVKWRRKWLLRHAVPLHEAQNRFTFPTFERKETEYGT
jgi:hypothetical protein